MMTTPQRMSALVDRIEARLEHHEECWIWTGALKVSFRQGTSVKKISVRRAVYERHIGPIPKGMRLRNQCFNEACVKPEHQVPATREDISEAKTKLLAKAEERSRAEFRLFLLDVRNNRVSK